jgi:hypothetical protein
MPLRSQQAFTTKRPDELMSNATPEVSRVVPQTPAGVRAPRKGFIRAMTAADIPAAARLFLKIFRGADKPANADLQEYLRALALDPPSYSETTGSQVYEQQDGRIRSVLLTVPMRMVVCGNDVPGRLFEMYMTDAEQEAAGAAEIILGLRRDRCDFSFSDSSSPTACRLLLAIGGKPIPSQNLEWSRSFRPLAAMIGRLADRLLRGRDFGLAAFARPVDALLRHLLGGKAEESTDVSVKEMSVPAFIKRAPRFIAHYAIRPLWSEEELSWAVSMAAQNTRLGSFTIRSVEDRTGTIIGCFVYYAAPRTAQVLNVLALPGRETDVLDAMFRHLDRTGHIEARGRAQPALMVGLALQRWLVFRHKAFSMALTRIAEAKDAVARGDIYVGGLAGEDWSRLMSDFH